MTIAAWLARGLGRLGARRVSLRAQDWALAREARRLRHPVILWEEPPVTHEVVPLELGPDLRVAEEAEVEQEESAPPNAPLRAAE